jgi:hypothetical protein
MARRVADVHVKVSMTRGDLMDVTSTVVVGVRPTLHIIAGRLPPADAQAVVAWIALNKAPIIDHWDGRIDTIRMGQELRPYHSDVISQRRPNFSFPL